MKSLDRRQTAMLVSLAVLLAVAAWLYWPTGGDPARPGASEAPRQAARAAVDAEVKPPMTPAAIVTDVAVFCVVPETAVVASFAKIQGEMKRQGMVKP